MGAFLGEPTYHPFTCDSFHLVSVAVYLADPVNIDSDENNSLRRYAALLRGKLSLFRAINVFSTLFLPMFFEAKSPLSWRRQPSALKTWPTMSWGAIPCWMWLRLGPNSNLNFRYQLISVPCAQVSSKWRACGGTWSPSSTSGGGPEFGSCSLASNLAMWLQFNSQFENQCMPASSQQHFLET